MGNIPKKLIPYLFYLLFFLTPLVLTHKTSELFEFNKMVLTYMITVLIVALWIIRIVIEKKVIFKRSILDIPLSVFLISQFLSTVVSLDGRTSFLGYYSRFHGGFASSLSYALLYWAYVSNMNREFTVKAIKIIFSSAVIVSVWGILEHYGRSLSCLIFPEFKTFDVSCWVQDVKNRVFASLGQPNWLAAWITALIPITWAFILKFKSEIKNTKYWLWVLLSGIFFTTLLFTKSRSGILGFSAAFILFWSFYIFYNVKTKKGVSMLSFISVILAAAITLALGTPWTPKLTDLFSGRRSSINIAAPIAPSGPALEVGGTESGKIRQIVWKGAIDIWKNYPVLGTGVETFAFSYYLYRPPEHNLVSEWDYLYNKAHNEYLNYAATTGSVGLSAYFVLICAIIFVFIKFQFSTPDIRSNSNLKNKKLNNSSEIEDSKTVNLALLAGFISILVTNFFGFSVVVVALQFFLYPAMAVSLINGHDALKDDSDGKVKITPSQTVIIAFTLLFTSYFVFLISRYWYADTVYAKGKLNNEAGNFVAAREILNSAIKLSPKEAVFWDELSDSTASLAIAASEQGEDDLAGKLAESAYVESKNAVNLSPANVNIKRNRANQLIKLSVINSNYLLDARNTLIEAAKLAPTEARLLYNLSLAYLRTGDYANAIKVMENVVNLKSDYRDAHFALALMYFDGNEKEKAKSELNFILNNINPGDAQVKRELEELGI